MRAMSRGIEKQDFLGKIIDHRRMGKTDGRKPMKNKLFEFKKVKSGLLSTMWKGLNFH